jgi:lipoprotein-releasing system permease protein
LNFPLYIAKRYLFTKTGNNAINIITIIASFGVIVGSLALFIILSGFSGLRTFSYSLLDVSDPDIKITSSKGKSFLYTENVHQALINNTSIEATSKIIEERVFLEYNDKNEIAYIKGVEENYTSITQIDSVLSLGNWLDNDFSNTAVVGNGISRKLSLGILNFGEALSIMVPKPGVGFINPNNAFYKINVQIVGLYSGTEEFENKFVFVSINSLEILLLAILEAINPKTVIVAITIKRLENLNSTG